MSSCDYNVHKSAEYYSSKLVFTCTGCHRILDLGCTHCVRARAERRPRDFCSVGNFGILDFSCQRCGSWVYFSSPQPCRATCLFVMPNSRCYAGHKTCELGIQDFYSLESGNSSGSGADAHVGERACADRASGSDVQTGSGAASHGEGSEGGEQPVHGECAVLCEGGGGESSDGGAGSGGAQVPGGSSVSASEQVNSAEPCGSGGDDEERDFYARNPSGGVGGRDGDRFRGYYFSNGGRVPELRPSGKHRSGGRFITVGDVHRFVTGLKSYAGGDPVHSSVGAHGASGDACSASGADGSRDSVGVLRGGAPAPAAENPALGGCGDGVETRVQEHVQLGGIRDVGLGSSAARGSDELRLLPVVRRCGGEVTPSDAEPGVILCASSGGCGSSVPADREETATGERRPKRVRKERSFLMDEY